MATFVALCVGAVSAQLSPAVSYTVGIWPSSVTLGPPLSAVDYPVASVKCGQPHLPEISTPIVNPIEVRIDDPANTTLDCVIDITAQVATLTPASGLRAAVRGNGANGSGVYGPTMTPFERRLGPPLPPAHPRLR